MEEPTEGTSTNYGKKLLNPFAVKKPKKRSLVERELETNMTARITSPVTVVDGASTSRYGRARRIKTGCDDRVLEVLKNPKLENIPVKPQPLIKQVASSSYNTETPKKAFKMSLGNTNNISQDNKTPSSTNKEVLPKNQSSKSSKVYIRKDLIQNRDDDDDIILIKDLFSPKSGRKQCKVIKSSSEKKNFSFNKKTLIENASVVKALDFDDNKNDTIGNKHDYVGDKKSISTGNKRSLDGNKIDSASRKSDSVGNKQDSTGNKQDFTGNKQDFTGNKQDSTGNKQDSTGNKHGSKKKKNDSQSVYKNQLSKLEESSPYQAGDLAWARMGTFPFWPCIITRDPESDMFVRKKLFGRIEHYILHVTFFADNGRRSWVVDNMLRKYMGLKEFISTRERFTNEDKRNNPRLYSAFFISEKKQGLWNTSVAEAETIDRVPTALRIDVFNDMLYRVRASKKQLKSGKITRTDSDVSLSESLYDSLFSEDDSKADDLNRQKNRTRNRSLDVSDVVTACLDNMAAITGNIKIQKQSHMDRWLQKAKSKTPEKVKTEQEASKTPVILPKIEIVTPNKMTPNVDIISPAIIEKPVSNNKKKKLPPKEVKITKVYSLRRSYESQNALINQPENEKSQSKNKLEDVSVKENPDSKDKKKTTNIVENEPVSSNLKKICSTDKNKDITVNDIHKNSSNHIIEPLKDNANKNSDEGNDDILNAINELLEDSSMISSNKTISKSRDIIEDSNKEITGEKFTDNTKHDLKPETMDVDEPKTDVKDKSDAMVIHDSPIKIEKESNLVSNCNSILIDCDSPVKTERESTETMLVANGSTTIEINVLNEAVHNILPIFKRNEMVSIPENFDMTDDESNFRTSIENDVDIQDHNSNLTNMSVKTKLDAVDIVDITVTEIDNSCTDVNPIEKPVELNISSEKLDTTKLDTNTVNETSKEIVSGYVEIHLIEESVKSDISIEKPIEGSVESKMSAEKHDNNMSIEKLDTNTVDVIPLQIVKNTFDVTPIKMGGTCAEINPIEDLVESNVSTENHDVSNEKDDTKSVNLTLKKIGSNYAEIDPIEKPVEFNISSEKVDTFAEKIDTNIDKADLLNEQHHMSIDEVEDEDVTMNEKDLLNESGESASILQIDDELNDFVNDKVRDKSANVSLDFSAKSESILESCKNDDNKVISIEIKLNENTPLSNNNNESNIFLGESHDIDVYKDNAISKDTYFREVNLSEPPDLTAANIFAKADLLLNDKNSDIDEDSDDEPSPEYEPLGDEITEDFRQHMKCIESSITDRKDEAQLVKVCNEIAIIEESKAKLADIKISTTDKTSIKVLIPNNSLNSATEQQSIIKEERIKLKSEGVKSEKVCNENYKNELTKSTDNDIIKDNNHDILGGHIMNNMVDDNMKPPSNKTNLIDISKGNKDERLDGLSIINKTVENNLMSSFDKKNYNNLTEDTKNDDITKHNINYEVLDGLHIIQKAVENSLKSPPDKKKHKLSLKRGTSIYEIGTKLTVFNDNTFNPRYKTIDQIEEIMKSKPTRLPIENSEVRIPEIKENGYCRANDTPDRYDDDDFDIDKVSVNSEDSEVSLPHEKVPARRSLRTRPKKGGLEDPDFLAYMEIRQDDLMEQHPELSVDDIVLYLYKTYAYAQKLEADAIEETEIVKSIKQETPTPPQKKSKKTIQPKNTIENFFRAKYTNAVVSERSAGSSDCNEDVKPKRETLSISPVDSGIGNSKDSNESDTPVAKRKTKSPQIDITKDVKVELINDKPKHTSPITPKKRNKISPRVLGSTVSISPNTLENSMNKRGPFVVISPIKDGRIGMILKRDTGTKPRFNIETKNEPVTVEDETVTKTKHEPVTETILAPVVETKYESVTESRHELVTKAKQEVVTEPKQKSVTEMKYEVVLEKTHDLVTETKQILVTKTNHESVIKTKQELVIEINHKPVIETNSEPVIEMNHEPVVITKHEQPTETKRDKDTETESVDSDSELPLRQLRTKVLRETHLNELKKELLDLKDEIDDTASAGSDNEPLLKIKPKKVDKNVEGSYEDPEFLTYFKLKQEHILDENPQLSQNEIKAYLYKTWIYEKDAKSDIRKINDIESSNLIKGLNQEPAPARKARRKPKTEKNIEFKVDEIIPKDKPKRKTVSHYYNEAFLSDIEDELEVFEIFKTKKASITVVSKPDSPKKEATTEAKQEENQKLEIENACEEINTLDEIELYFKQLTSSKPSVFKGLIREKVCEICEDIANLIKCKSCHGTFHYDCVNKVVEIVETPIASKGRKRKKRSKKLKNLEDSDHSDSQDVSAENVSIEDIPESITIDAETLESQLEAKMKELLEKESQFDYDSYTSDDGVDWAETVPGKCELVDVKLKKRPIDLANFKCNNCQKHDTPVCFVCKSAVSKTDVKIRQRCNVAHCNRYYHIECLDHWPQTQFNAGELSRSYKKTNGQLETLTCPRHVCHTCVSDDPRGCKTRFSGDKLAKCVRCPATYHSFNKCLPAGTQILTASLIICPRHYEHRPGKVPCHVNTGWCFICALGGSLICCEYCPTSFHAECLNIKPPEGNYMCEDCETGRLPLYGEMVWVKLGHYRWWPGVILHPSEIPDNIMAVKHGLGEFVVRFFGQYDHYWVNRGRVFPYQEGDSGRISSQKSKIDVAFTTAMEHAQRAFEILKNAEPDEEESLDIASSLLPPHYVKLKCNKPIGSLLGRKIEDPSLSLTQCECNPAEYEPCGPNTQCINRMLLTECGPTCRAGDRCNNRAFEKRLYPKLTPYKASNRGWGLKTLEDIKAGQFVIEYVGELIDEEEFQRRMSRMHEIRDENFYFLTLDKERMIDAGPKGNLARFMNHCCEPNCETQKWTVLGDIRVGLFAINNIKANSEVTFNYNLECSGIEKKRCLCGARRCSGYIGAKPKQLVDESQRKKNGTLTGKRKYTKRKNIEVNPATVKKVKRPLGRPPKPKLDLTEIQKDLLIIKSATIASSEESRSQSVEEKNLKPLKKKIDSNSTEEVAVLNAGSNKEIKYKIESNSTEEVAILNAESSKEIKKKLDSNSTEEVAILNAESNKEILSIDNQTPESTVESKTAIEIIPNGIDEVDSKLDLNIKQEDTISNSTEPSKTLKRKLDLNSTEEVTISNEPNAKRQKCDKQIEVGD